MIRKILLIFLVIFIVLTSGCLIDTDNKINVELNQSGEVEEVEYIVNYNTKQYYEMKLRSGTYQNRQDFLRDLTNRLLTNYDNPDYNLTYNTSIYKLTIDNPSNSEIEYYKSNNNTFYFNHNIDTYMLEDIKFDLNNHASRKLNLNNTEIEYNLIYEGKILKSNYLEKSDNNKFSGEYKIKALYNIDNLEVLIKTNNNNSSNFNRDNKNTDVIYIILFSIIILSIIFSILYREKIKNLI